MDILCGILFWQMICTIFTLIIDDEEILRYAIMGVWLPIVILLNNIMD